MGGTITGPALNGTIHSGASTPHVTDDGVFAYSIRNYYGTTTDGEDFFIEQRGVGEWTKEQTWMVNRPILNLRDSRLMRNPQGDHYWRGI